MQTYILYVICQCNNVTISNYIDGFYRPSGMFFVNYWLLTVVYEKEGIQDTLRKNDWRAVCWKNGYFTSRGKPVFQIWMNEWN